MLLQEGHREQEGLLSWDAMHSAPQGTQQPCGAPSPSLMKEVLDCRTWDNRDMPLPSPPSAQDQTRGSIYLPRM